MNILDARFRNVACFGEVFQSYEAMISMHPDWKDEDVEHISSGQWLLDPYTGEAKSEDEWHMDWLENIHEEWEGLGWAEVKSGLLVPVVVIWNDPEEWRYIPEESAMDMMKMEDKDLMEEIAREPCIEATVQDIWNAFCAYQLSKLDIPAEQV